MRKNSRQNKYVRHVVICRDAPENRPGSPERRTWFPRESPRFPRESSLPDLRSRRHGCRCPETARDPRLRPLYALTSLSRSSAARANPLILRVFCLPSPMSRLAAASLRRSRYSSHTRRSMLPVAPCLRPRALHCAGRAPHPPEVPWKRRYRFATLPCTGRMWVRTHTRDLEHLADSKVRRTTISWRESSSLSPNTSSGDRACGLTGGGFSTTAPAGRVRADDTRSLPCPRPALNTAASAPSRATVWSLRRITCRRSASTKARYPVCYTRRTNHRLRTGMTPKGREWREGADWNALARPGGGAEAYRVPCAPGSLRRRPRDRPEGGGVSTSRDRNRGSPAAVREPLPVCDHVPTRLNGRVRLRFRGVVQTRARARDR